MSPLGSLDGASAVHFSNARSSVLACLERTMIKRIRYGFSSTCDYCGEFIRADDKSYVDEKSGLEGCCLACCRSAARNAESINRNKSVNRQLSATYANCSGE